MNVIHQLIGARCPVSRLRRQRHDHVAFPRLAGRPCYCPNECSPKHLAKSYKNQNIRRRAASTVSPRKTPGHHRPTPVMYPRPCRHLPMPCRDISNVVESRCTRATGSLPVSPAVAGAAGSQCGAGRFHRAPRAENVSPPRKGNNEIKERKERERAGLSPFVKRKRVSFDR